MEANEGAVEVTPAEETFADGDRVYWIRWDGEDLPQVCTGLIRAPAMIGGSERSVGWTVAQDSPPSDQPLSLWTNPHTAGFRKALLDAVAGCRDRLHKLCAEQRAELFHTETRLGSVLALIEECQVADGAGA